MVVRISYHAKLYLVQSFPCSPIEKDIQYNHMEHDHLFKMRHSAAHLLAMAVLQIRPHAKLGIGPVIEHGFYYDFDLDTPLTPEDLVTLEGKIHELITANFAFTCKPVSREEAKQLHANQPYKLELIDDLPESQEITVYESGNFVDLCKGPHVERSSQVSPHFKLLSLAGAYWRGDEKRPMLQRVYGVLFATQEELDNYLQQVEEAKKRDHRKLGQELELFSLINEIGPGLPLFYPKGTILRQQVENLVERIQAKRGYQQIWIPHITKGELYKISGHLDKYDAMYPPMHLEGETDYYLKPMNCPHFMMLFKTTPHSYRELPVRWTCTTTNYRYEKSGELSGLTRVRSLTQDDCHVFCTEEQIAGEINLMLDMIDELYTTFGFADFWVRISTHDPADRDKYIGSDEMWHKSEAALKELIQDRGWKHEIGVGEAAFYGPKLDFMFKDAIGRQWQLSTIQLDVNLPERFDLTYVDANGELKRPVVIHRAMLGSTERFLGILIEHFAGDFPLWLAPVQVAILPISEKVNDYARNVEAELKQHGIRTYLDESNESVGKKIRNAETQKYPIMLIVGQKEVEANTVSVRSRKEGDKGSMSLTEFLQQFDFSQPS